MSIKLARQDITQDNAEVKQFRNSKTKIKLKETYKYEKGLLMIFGQPLTYKIIVAGQGAVGKTTMLKRYQSGKFIPAITTIGVNFIVKEYDFQGKTLTLSIWDYAGEARFRALFPSYCSGSTGALVVFDLTRPQTMEELEPWIDIVREQNGDIPCILIGSKKDLVDEEEINFQLNEGKDYVNEIGLAGVYLCSSKTGEGIDDVFEFLALQITNYIAKKKR
ncbi:MAG: Rab family GTPase [Candidatus Odinarchaeota archaeon]